MAAIASPIDDQSTTPDPADPLLALLRQALPRSHSASIGHLGLTALRQHVQKGDVLFHQDQLVRPTLFIRGYGAFLRTTLTGQQVTVGIANQGQLYGITAVSSAMSSVDLVALTDCEVAHWPGQTLRHLAAVDPDLALDCIDYLSRYMILVTRKVDGFLHQDSRLRVMRVLARYQDLFFVDPPVLTRSHLPGLVGTSREMTGRVLRDLERDGTITRVGRTGLRLNDPARLAAAAGEETPPPLS